MGSGDMLNRMGGLEKREEKREERREKRDYQASSLARPQGRQLN